MKSADRLPDIAAEMTLLSSLLARFVVEEELDDFRPFDPLW